MDICGGTLDAVRGRLGTARAAVQFVERDVLSCEPDRTFDVWHDRALFHFLTSAVERRRYVSVASRVVSEQGVIVLATFAEDGPEHCSGLLVNRYSSEKLAQEFASLSLVHSERVEHVTPGGGVQPFTYAVLRRSVA